MDIQARAPKRALATLDNPSPKKLRPQTAEEKLAHLTLLARHSDPTLLMNLLKAIAHGDITDPNFPDDRGTAFGDMLCKGDYALFVAAFNMHHEARVHAAQQAGEPPSSAC